MNSTEAQPQTLIGVVELPVTARPQRFQVALNGVIYTIRLYWLWPAQYWVIDIIDNTNQPLILGIPLVTGTDLLRQFQHILRGSLLVLSDSIPELIPDFTHLGITGHVYFMAR